MMLYLSYTPRTPLNQLVERLWLVSGGQLPRQERILPSGTVELVINLHDDRITIDRTLHCDRSRAFSGAVISGPYSGAFIIDGMQHELMMGVHFKPGGAFAALGIAASELADTHFNLADIWGDTAARGLRERLCGTAAHRARFECLEQALTQLLPSTPRMHPVVPFALERFSTRSLDHSVRDVAREAGLSHRRLLTIFTATVGLSPKVFCRILRFRRLHELAQQTGRIDWAQLALACGFFDQSHLANEFRKLSGVTPTEYQRDLQTSRDVLEGHVAIS
jgi:AraC-like DNA-binding protein